MLDNPKKNSAGTRVVAFFAEASAMRKKGFITLTPVNFVWFEQTISSLQRKWEPG
jgi:hypothetical protein